MEKTCFLAAFSRKINSIVLTNRQEEKKELEKIRRTTQRSTGHSTEELKKSRYEKNNVYNMRLEVAIEIPLQVQVQETGNMWFYKQCCGTVTLYYGSGFDFLQVTVPAP
jgi:hypothetical protein